MTSSHRATWTERGSGAVRKEGPRDRRQEHTVIQRVGEGELGEVGGTEGDGKERMGGGINQ